MIYLINKETNEVINTYHNVISWGVNFVEYLNSGYRGKVYCNDGEFFTDIEPSTITDAPEENTDNDLTEE